MSLRSMFYDSEIDFKKRCRTRIGVGVVIVLMGLLSIAASAFYDSSAAGEIAGSAGRANSFFSDPEFYIWTGIGLVIGGVVSVSRNRYYLKNEDAFHKREIIETDERNRLLGLRCWAYSGYVMFLILYLGFLASGFLNFSTLEIFSILLAAYALILIFLRRLLQKIM